MTHFAWLLVSMGVSFVAFQLGHLKGHSDGLVDCPSHNDRIVAEQETLLQSLRTSEAKANLHAKKIEVCDAEAKKEWIEHISDNICPDYWADREEEPMPDEYYSQD